MRRLLAIALLSLSALGFSQTVGDIYIIETRTGGLNLANYSDIGGAVMQNSTGKSTAAGCTAAIGSTYCTLSVLNKKVRFTPNGAAFPVGRHQWTVQETHANVASINATGVTYRVKRGNSQIVTGTYSQTNTINNAWENVGAGSWDFDKAVGSYIEMDTSTANSGVVDAAKRYYADAVKLTLTALNVPVAVSSFNLE